MRIVVNDIAASTGGAMTVLRDFHTWVCENDRENEWIFLLGDRYFEETENVRIRILPEIKKSGWKKLWFDFVTGRKYIESLEPDVVFSLQNIITFGVKVPQVVYIHQSIPFQTTKRFSFLRASERKLAVIQYLIGSIIKLSARKSDCVIVQTKWMQEAVCEMCQLPTDKVMTSLPRVKAVPQPNEAVVFEPTKFFYPTAPASYKNNECIFRGSELLDKKGIKHEVTLTLAPEKARGSVNCVGRLPYEQLFDYYRGGTLIFPSYIETFGYPMAEARCVGTLVLASDTPFSREVLDGYENAYFFDPFCPEELADLMGQVATGKLVRREVIEVAAETADAWAQVTERITTMKK